MTNNKVYLKPNAIAEPLINQWYAWSYLIPPVSCGMYIANSHVEIMESFVEAPHVHRSALRNSAMMGGPFINYDVDRVDEIRDLLVRTKEEQVNLLELAEGIEDLERVLQEKGDGYSLEPLYEKVPEVLRGYVELVYDTQNHPGFRLIEGLLYRCRDYQTVRQTVALSLRDEDSRSFVLSTPRLPEEDTLHLDFRFDNPVWDRLFRMRYTPDSYREIKEVFNIKPHQEAVFEIGRAFV